MEHDVTTRLAGLACAIFLAAWSAVGVAGQTTWKHEPASPGAWEDGANWTAGEPEADDDASISNGGTAVVSLAGELCRTLRVGYLDANSGTVSVTGGGLTAAT